MSDGPEAAPVFALLSFRDRAERLTALNCRVHELDRDGAHVSLREPYVVPYEFTFTPPGGLPRKARKMWVRVTEMGLQYTG